MASVHASAVAVGARAVLIRGPSGAGKSQLAFALLNLPQPPFARLVADDRALLEPHNDRLIVRPAGGLEGLIEVRGLGIRRVAFEPAAVVGLVVDLGAEDAARFPPDMARTTSIEGLDLPRVSVGPGLRALDVVVAALFCGEAR